MRRAIFIIPFLFLLSSSLSAQLTVDNTITPEEALEELLGEGITVSNITFSGDLNQIGTFGCNSCGVNIESGVILATGDTEVAEGPNDIGSASLGGGNNDATDPDLETIQEGLNDAAILEFDFVPTGDSVKFNYVWASEEYPEFVPGEFGGGINDVFGFFLSGPGIDGPYQNNAENIAEIPGTDLAVSIANLNNGPDADGPCMNCEFYIDNQDNTDPNTIQFDGYTVVMTAKSAVQCGETYHIKIAIADASDTSWDSGVFLEGGSFTSELISLDLDLGAVGVNDSTVYEGCGQNTFIFTRPEGNSSATSIDLAIGGTAENGVDYEELPTSVFFPEDVYEVEVPFHTILDDIDEGLESLIITFETQLECTGATIESTYTFYIQDPEPLSVVSPPIDSDCGIELSLEPEISGGYGIYNIEWESGSVGFPLDSTFYESTTLNYTVTDTCGMEPIDGSLDINLPDYPPLNVDLGPDQQLDCLDDLVVDPDVDGGSETYTYQWLNNDGDTLTVASILDMQGIDIGPGTVTLNVQDECLTEASDNMEISFPPVPVNVNVGPDITATCLDTNIIFSEVSGGVGDYSYEWFEAGQSISTEPQIEVNVGETTEYELVVEDQCGNVNSDLMSLIIPDDPISLTTHNDTVICYGDSVEIFAFATGGQGGYSYQWQPVNEINVTEIEDRPWESTTYSIYAVDVCGNETEAEILVEVEEVIANFNYDEIGDWGLNFQNASNIDGEYFWDFGDGTTSTEENPNHNFYDLEPHTITLHVSTENFCSDSASITYYPDMNIYIPDAFTPNSDGINDFFKVEGHDIQEFEIWIFNRWGKVVYHSTDIDEVWDGGHERGDYYVEDETYTYRIKATGIAGNEIEKTGNIIILR